MIERLAEFEMNGSSLLMKYRDHYSHSAYVFLLGLAIFHKSPQFWAKYKEIHMKNEKASDKEASHN